MTTVRSAMGGFVDGFGGLTELYDSIIRRKRLGVVFSVKRNTRYVYNNLELAYHVRACARVSGTFRSGLACMETVRNKRFACVDTYRSTDEPQELENVVASLYLT